MRIYKSKAKRPRVSCNSVNLERSCGCVFEDRLCEYLTKKRSAFKKVVSRIANSRVRRIMNKFGLRKDCKQIRIMNE